LSLNRAFQKLKFIIIYIKAQLTTNYSRHWLLKPLTLHYMFAIIDIETCAGKFEYRKGRITEICILVHDGLQVVEKFTSLINPECYISPYFTSLTGITNDMVKDAPTFAQIAKKILELTTDKIFVAHNVGFDYGFIKEEFASLGYAYKRETLCTVRLSRKFIPNKFSYSLGNLCQSLGIENEARHRAEGDAVATAKLFDLILQLKSNHPQYKNQGVEALMTRRIDKIKQYILDKIPETCGVYYFLNKEQHIIYIGKSTNMHNRAVSHFNSKESKSKKMLNDLYHVDFVETGSELIALLLESDEIKKHKPHYNRMRKAEIFTHSIDWFKDAKGIVCLKLVEYEFANQPLMSFVSYATGRERLEAWIDDYELCLRFCGLASEEAVCFNHQLKKCKGICNNDEEIESYNKRVIKLIKEHSYTEPNFILIDRGRNIEEQALVLIENATYKGFGYIDSSIQFTNPNELKEVIKKINYFPDSDILIKSWLKKNNIKKIVLP
jgi:DNA polymerase III subunit epsilon